MQAENRRLKLRLSDVMCLAHGVTSSDNKIATTFWEPAENKWEEVRAQLATKACNKVARDYEVSSDHKNVVTYVGSTK